MAYPRLPESAAAGVKPVPPRSGGACGVVSWTPGRLLGLGGWALIVKEQSEGPVQVGGRQAGGGRTRGTRIPGRACHGDVVDSCTGGAGPRLVDMGAIVSLGEIHGDATGLDYAANRYYSSQWGRFLSPDPYGGSISPRNPQTWNRYRDPVNGADPLGLYSQAPRTLLQVHRAPRTPMAAAPTSSMPGSPSILQASAVG